MRTRKEGTVIKVHYLTHDTKDVIQYAHLVSRWSVSLSGNEW